MGTAARHLKPDPRPEKARIVPIKKTVLINARVPIELAEEVRFAVYTRGHEDTLSHFVSEAIASHLVEYRRIHNNGKPFSPPPGGVALKTGRPMKLPASIRRRRKVSK